MIFKHNITKTVLYKLPVEEFWSLPMKYFKKIIAQAHDEHKFCFTNNNDDIILCTNVNILNHNEILYLLNTLESDTDWTTLE